MIEYKSLDEKNTFEAAAKALGEVEPGDPLDYHGPEGTVPVTAVRVHDFGEITYRGADGANRTARPWFFTRRTTACPPPPRILSPEAPQATVYPSLPFTCGGRKLRAGPESVWSER
ncbi:hypothetical protein [Mycolicibacterium mucogenicum]|jgi:hypothetical protein|uniref:Uncharacterized protein n=1 Tax=Mycolicibacterium mucogenicum TaxID=56689 RepID=A0A4R5WIL0_MYCMU|nr:hypothetical protein [Mycolicibacterium mucogenicum]MCX8557869.1 hypothetical protein [Mycolicibacterium mucogenicum]TDK89600.1 hypothetical protein EUA03_12525 [Mycolicibacterium mucogenicum]TXH17181.1 MAG: hypothetical protein E6R06_29330 [Mycobacterium sp.]